MYKRQWLGLFGLEENKLFMMADSPYETRTLVLSPSRGAAAGLIAAILMLVFLGLAETVFSSSWSEQGLLSAGSATHLFWGVVFGVLYAVSQRRIPFRGLLSVGLFYGFLLWIVSSLFVDRSWLWLLGYLVFGLVLALLAFGYNRRSPQSPQLLIAD